jgi:hypothetical protein
MIVAAADNSVAIVTAQENQYCKRKKISVSPQSKICWLSETYIPAEGETKRGINEFGGVQVERARN